LLLLNFTGLAIAQLSTSLCKASPTSRESTALPSSVSSANLLHTHPIPASRSLTKPLKSTGPETEPWGTSPVTGRWILNIEQTQGDLPALPRTPSGAWGFASGSPLAKQSRRGSFLMQGASHTDEAFQNGRWTDPGAETPSSQGSKRDLQTRPVP